LRHLHFINVYKTKLMRKTMSISYFVILMLYSSCITIKTNKPGDGSSTLTHKDSLLIMSFNDSMASKSFINSKPDEITFEMIDAENLKSLVKQKPVNWIFIGSSWCGISKYARKKYCRSIRHFEPDSIQMIMIDQDFDLHELQKQVFESEFTHITYLLDPVKYGRDEAHKQERFIEDCKIDLPMKLFKWGGVPKSIVVDNKMNVLYYASGPDINSDTIVKYTGLKKIK
jgi:hypothetical protein